MTDWEDVFSGDGLPWKDGHSLDEPLVLRDLAALRRFLDAVHVRQCLARPYLEGRGYPVVESRELLPSFECDLYEYKNLPGFSLVALARPLDSFAEIFQYDKLHGLGEETGAPCCPLEDQVLEQNIATVAARLPRAMRENFERGFAGEDISALETYPALFPYLLELDRAQVLSWDQDNNFHLSGVFASFPSDIDSELKRFGIRIGKFANGDSELYERNRMFVYQYLMELYGYPIAAERRTSGALFARRLHRMGERFLLRVLGQSDRTITTYISDGSHSRYPRVEKLALVRVEREQEDAIRTLEQGGYFLDRAERVVIMRVCYRQHRFDPGNVRQDRALSVAAQEILHPISGKALAGLNIIRDSSNMFLRLNDIVRGEHTGRIVYKRSELVENTDTDEKRLKFLYSWLCKHQRRMITFSDEYFARVDALVGDYLHSPKKEAVFAALRPLRKEVGEKMSYIRQARRVRALEELARRSYQGGRISYRQMTALAVAQVGELRFEIVDFFPELVEGLIRCLDLILRDRYLIRSYIAHPDKSLTAAGQEIRKNYGRLVTLRDQIAAVARMRAAQKDAEASVA